MYKSLLRRGLGMVRLATAAFFRVPHHVARRGTLDGGNIKNMDRGTLAGTPYSSITSKARGLAWGKRGTLPY